MKCLDILFTFIFIMRVGNNKPLKVVIITSHCRNRDEFATLIDCLKESRPIPRQRGVESLRCDTPLSHVSSATGIVTILVWYKNFV